MLPLLVLRRVGKRTNIEKVNEERSSQYLKNLKVKWASSGGSKYGRKDHQGHKTKECMYIYMVHSSHWHLHTRYTVVSQVHVHVCTRLRVSAHPPWALTWDNTVVCTYTCTCMCLPVMQQYTCNYMYMYVHLYVQQYTCNYMYMYVHLYVPI